MEIQTSTNSSVGRELSFIQESIHTHRGGLAGKVYKDKESGEKFYVSYREYEKHCFHKFDSWAISIDILENLGDRNIEKIMIIDTDKGDIHIHDLQDYQETENEIHYEDAQKAPNMKEAYTYEDVFNGSNIERYPNSIEI